MDAETIILANSKPICHCVFKLAPNVSRVLPLKFPKNSDFQKHLSNWSRRNRPAVLIRVVTNCLIQLIDSKYLWKGWEYCKRRLLGQVAESIAVCAEYFLNNRIFRILNPQSHRLLIYE